MVRDNRITKPNTLPMLGVLKLKALDKRSPQHPYCLRETLVLLLLSVLGSIPARANPSIDGDLSAVVDDSTAQLRNSWAADPATARLPFPRVQLLPQGVDVSGACSPGAPAREAAPTAIYCASRATVLLQHDLLSLAYRINKARAVSYWIAVGLAEYVRPRQEGLSPAASSLQTSCVAGVLLGATGTPQPAEAADRYLSAAAKAYGDLFSAVVGTGPQRAFAVLSGFGATSLDCGATAMARLAADQVPIPLGLGIRGPGSLGMEVSCRQPPACPRRLPSGAGGV
jgi:hypothetical protein